MFRPSHADEVPPLYRGVDGEDSNKDGDGFERIGEVVREGALLRAELAPEEGLAVRGEDVDEEGGEGGGEAGEEEEGKEDGEWLSGDPGLTKEGGAESGEAGAVARGARGGGRGRCRGAERGGGRVWFPSSFGATGPPPWPSFLVA